MCLDFLVFLDIFLLEIFNGFYSFLTPYGPYVQTRLQAQAAGVPYQGLCTACFDTNTVCLQLVLWFFTCNKLWLEYLWLIVVFVSPQERKGTWNFNVGYFSANYLWSCWMLTVFYVFELFLLDASRFEIFYIIYTCSSWLWTNVPSRL